MSLILELEYRFPSFDCRGIAVTGGGVVVAAVTYIFNLSIRPPAACDSPALVSRTVVYRVDGG